MQVDTSRHASDRGITSPALRFVLIAIGCAEWLGAWTVVYRSALGL